MDEEKLKAAHIIFLSCGGVYLCILIDGVRISVVVMSFNIMYVLFMLFCFVVGYTFYLIHMILVRNCCFDVCKVIFFFSPPLFLH